MPRRTPPALARGRKRVATGNGLQTILLPHPTKIPMMNAFIRSEKLERLETAEAGLARNTPYHVLRTELARKYRVSDAMAESYIRQARQRWRSEPVADVDQKRVELERQFQTFYQVCMAKGAYASAGRALRELALMWGVYQQAASSAAAGGSKAAEDESTPEVDPDRIRARMADLMEKHADECKKARDGLPEDPHDAPQILPPEEK